MCISCWPRVDVHKGEGGSGPCGQGEGGQKPDFFVDVINGWPLKHLNASHVNFKAPSQFIYINRSKKDAYTFKLHRGIHEPNAPSTKKKSLATPNVQLHLKMKLVKCKWLQGSPKIGELQSFRGHPFMTSTRRGIRLMWTHVDRGNQKPDLLVYVINGWPVISSHHHKPFTLLDLRRMLALLKLHHDPYAPST